MPKPTEWYYCLQCRAEFPVDDAMVIDLGGVPPEYEHHCPDCNSINLREECRAWCESCDKVQVSDEGEQCSECYTCQAEEFADAARGH